MAECGGGMSIMDREVCERCGNHLCYLFVYEKEHLVKVINAACCGFDSTAYRENVDESDCVITMDAAGRMKRMKFDEAEWKVDFEWTYDSFLPSDGRSCPKYAEHLVSALNKT